MSELLVPFGYDYMLKSSFHKMVPVREVPTVSSRVVYALPSGIIPPLTGRCTLNLDLDTIAEKPIWNHPAAAKARPSGSHSAACCGTITRCTVAADSDSTAMRARPTVLSGKTGLDKVPSVAADGVEPSEVGCMSASCHSLTDLASAVQSTP